MKPRTKPSKWYECGHCLALFEVCSEAEQCCPLQVRDVYECPGCRIVYGTYSEAAKCCKLDASARS